MKLTEEQIQKLYLFTSQHYVKHYDLQTELVDHLANGIEQQVKENPNLTFEQGLKKEFKKFGVCGFSDVVEDRRKAMGKRYRKYIFRYYKEYFQIPQVLKLIAFTISAYLLLQIVDSAYKLLALSIIAIVTGGTIVWYNWRNRRKYQNKVGTLQKRWMMEEMIANLGGGGSLAIFPLNIFQGFISGGNYYLDNTYLEFSICALIISYFTLCYVMVFVIPQKAEELLKETYPEYKII